MPYVIVDDFDLRKRLGKKGTDCPAISILLPWQSSLQNKNGNADLTGKNFRFATLMPTTTYGQDYWSMPMKRRLFQMRMLKQGKGSEVTLGHRRNLVRRV